jgi:hypothetical protein
MRANAEEDPLPNDVPVRHVEPSAVSRDGAGRAACRGSRPGRPTRYRLTVAGYTLVGDLPSTWHEERVQLRSIQHWRFVVLRADVHNLPDLLDVSRSTGPITEFVADDQIGEPS